MKFDNKEIKKIIKFTPERWDNTFYAMIGNEVMDDLFYASYARFVECVGGEYGSFALEKANYREGELFLSWIIRTEAMPELADEFKLIQMGADILSYYLHQYGNDFILGLNLQDADTRESFNDSSSFREIEISNPQKWICLMVAYYDKRNSTRVLDKILAKFPQSESVEDSATFDNTQFKSILISNGLNVKDN